MVFLSVTVWTLLVANNRHSIFARSKKEVLIRFIHSSPPVVPALGCRDWRAGGIHTWGEAAAPAPSYPLPTTEPTPAERQSLFLRVT